MKWIQYKHSTIMRSVGRPRKDLSREERKSSGGNLRPNFNKDKLLILFISIPFLLNSRRGGKQFDLTQFITDTSFDHLGLVGTSMHSPPLPDDYRISQIFIGPFMNKKIDVTTAFNHHDSLSIPFQYGGTSSLSTGNIIGRNISCDRYPTGLGRWSSHRFRVQVKDTLRIVSFYCPPSPTQGRSGFIYAQHQTYFSDIKIIVCSR